MEYQFVTADVFTDRVFGGNPLAVFPDGGGLSDAQMQLVAGELNLSETVFVLPPEDPAHSCKLRIFTPEMELPFAGHPTVGTAYILAATGRIPLAGETTAVVFEEGVGPISVTILAKDRTPQSTQFAITARAETGPPPPAAADIAAMLSLEAGDLAAGGPGVRAVSCGVPFLIVPIRDRAALGRIRVNQGVWSELLADFWAPHIYAITADGGDGADLRARMFAPAMGIGEDPATGAAATALGADLAMQDARPSGAFAWVIAQGVEMGRPSHIHVEAEKADGVVSTIRVGGQTVLVGRGSMEIPSG